jgi:NAD(P)-dependent dehydrogenase (short-subunit alcohol dehydrogenase family)/acyl carrier protein
LSPRLTGAASFLADAEYLITGGTGGMALKVARWMAERGARHISLAARREAGASVALAVNSIEADTGAHVTFVRADVSDEAQMAAALASLRSTGRALRGIVHCAGVFDDRVLLNHDWSRFERVLAPKVKGAWILHEQTKSDPLDFFVLFSSAASVLPGSGLSNYAAANAFMDSLAHYRRSLGQPALSINWCPWADTGMAEAVGGAREGQWSQAGLSTITSDEGLAILGQTLSGSAPQYAVLPIDWTKYIERFAPGAYPALLSDVAPASPGAGSAPAENADGLRNQVERALAAQRHDVILAHVRDRVGEVLGFGGSHRVDPERGLFDIGLDSLTAVELKNVLQKSVGQPLPSTLVFDYPSVQTLSGFIAREVFHLDATTAPDDEAAPKHPAGLVDDDRQSLSEDELADLLVQKLTRMQS